ncbi:hypothetical protein KY290_010070 [Solanum tuberosum]|uniref:Uncharacterized protein n=1 Tax=Solanum tuberosum TaxID=4113 RepID=A0ABQ7VYR9_SOLTU|nr:hypothetical protein KY289_010452 [Solanum tuberosum]KAH0708595.1 hypothetical protein KY284_010022 [Solanum tuberosum]KAH0772933.1 hypothetical protein KY290_010070 [Solanum tuberosum]
MNQYDMIMPVSNPASGLSFPADQNLLQQGRGGGEVVLISTFGNNADSNAVVILSRVNLGTRGSMRREDIERESMETTAPLRMPVQFNPVPELSFTFGQNLPSEGYNADSNRVVIPSSGSVRARSTRRGVIGTNPQYPNAPPSTSTTRAPLDPFLRLLASNPDFRNRRNNK